MAPTTTTVTGKQDDLGTQNGHVSASKGPDMVIPTEDPIVWDRELPVKLRIEDSGAGSHQPISLMSMFQNTVKRAPEHPAICVKRGSDWTKWSYRKYYDDCWRAAKSFIKLGLEPLHGVGILGFNSPEWFISDIGSIFAGGLATGIYTTNSAEACQFVASSARCNIIVVENDQQLQKILQVRSELPDLKAIVQYIGNPKEDYPDVYNWEQFMSVGREVSDDVLQERIQQQAPNKCCTLIYTSGTTGNPKGVMLSHDNLTWTAEVGTRAAKIEFQKEVQISYLPLSHIAAQMLDIIMPILKASTVYFARPDALKGTLGDTLKEVRPTSFLGVPRVWEKMQEKMVAVGRSSGAIKKKIAVWAKGVGLRGNRAKMEGGSLPFGWGLANALVFKKVKAALGLDRCRYCLTAAAPIMKETLEFFLSLDIPIFELYGMSENSGPHTVSFPWKQRLTSVGSELPGVHTKLANPDPDSSGEICMRGRHVFMGYLGSEEKTREAMDDDGWLHSGDVGKKDKDGFLFITGRIKELIITAGGENVAPVPIEDIVKEELPIVSNCMLIGDKKKFLSILLTMKVEVDEETMMPKDELAQQALDWCHAQNSSVKTLSQILENKDTNILEAIQKGIDRANAKSVSRAQKIQKWTILPRDFSIPGGELGPTLKLKRPVVSKMYKATIDAFYEE